VGGAAVTGYAATLGVLVIDDEPLLRSSIRDVLEAAGHAVRVASGESDALPVGAAMPAVDVILWGHSRLEHPVGLLTPRLRQRFPTAAIIVMSAFVDRDFKRQAWRDGADRVLSKPFSLMTLPAYVDECHQCRPI
jgi:DNA-binding NarL/FixJ family response regulator